MLIRIETFVHILVAAGLVLTLSAPFLAEEPRTRAELSDFQATSSHAEVVAFCENLARLAPCVRLTELGKSREGRSLPVLVLADPPVASADEAQRSGKLVVLAFANIHAGEVDGKEALMMLARELALAKDQPQLKHLVLAFAPIFNADGNERLGNHRPTQAGPAQVGMRTNADGLDLNRDFVKLESPEVQALVRFMNAWDPAIVIDCHTTNGSYHRYALTYEGGRCPAGCPKLVQFVGDQLLPAVARTLRRQTGYDSFYYGNFSADRSLWETVPPTPRYGVHYIGLRNRIGILSESYSYAAYRDRVLASKGFVAGIIDFAAENHQAVRQQLDASRARTLEAGRNPGPNDRIVLRERPAPWGRPVAIRGFVEELKNGRRVPTQQPRDYEVQYMAGSEPVLSVQRPFAYLLPASLKSVHSNLRKHGVVVEELAEPAMLDLEVYQVRSVKRGAAFQKHQPVSVEVVCGQEQRMLEAGTLCVRSAQPLGSLAAYLLEPQSADGLATWNFLDDQLKEGAEYPIARLPSARPLATRPAPWRE